MYYGWNIDIYTETGLQTAGRYYDENNIMLRDINPSNHISVSNPSSNILNSPSLSTVVVIPIGNVTRLPIGEISPGIFVVDPVSPDSVPAGAPIRQIYVQGAFETVMVICLCIIVVAGMIALASKYWSEAWEQVNYDRAIEAANDVLMKNMEVTQEGPVDLDNDGVDDIYRIVWATGKSVVYALSAYGLQVLGTSELVVEEEGTPYEPIIPDPPGGEDWMTYILVVGGILVAIVLLPKLIDMGSHGGGQAYFAPAPGYVTTR